MPPKPSRTISIYDKGSSYLLLGSDDVTALYHVHWNTVTLPHMTITHAFSGKSEKPAGAANFIPQKTAGFATADLVELDIGGHQTSLTKIAPSSLSQSPSFFSSLKRIFATDKRYFDAHGTTMCWEGGVAASGFLKLINLSTGNTLATYKNTAYDGRRMGKIEIFAEPLTQEELDEIVVSGMAMLSEQKTSMGYTAASMASAGGMSG